MDSNGSTSVAGLFSECDIAAIAWFVIAVYVITLNGQVLSVAIGQRPISKRFEFLPFGANYNSASTVVFVCGISDSVTTGFHALPNAVKPVGSFVFSIAGHSMFQAGLAKLHVMRVLSFAMARLKASAISRAAFPEVIGVNPASFSTLALAEPESSFPAIFREMYFVRTYDSPMAKYLVS